MRRIWAICSVHWRPSCSCRFWQISRLSKYLPILQCNLAAIPDWGRHLWTRNIDKYDPMLPIQWESRIAVWVVAITRKCTLKLYQNSQVRWNFIWQRIMLNLKSDQPMLNSPCHLIASVVWLIACLIISVIKGPWTHQWCFCLNL